MTLRKEIVIDGNITPLQRKLAEAGDSFVKFGQRIQSSFTGVRDAIGNLGNIMAVLGASKLAGIADEATLISARLRDVTGSASEAVATQSGAYAMAQRLQVGYGEVAGSIARMLPMVREMGGGVNESSRLAEILISTARLSGASAAEAASSTQQFAQALGSGVLQGDELKSILENNSTLARALAKALGTNVGALKEMGAEGKLTADVVGNALLGQYDEIQSRTAALPDTVGGAWTRITNAFQFAVDSFNNGTGAFGAVAAVMTSLANVVEAVARSLGVTGSEGDRLARNTTIKQWGETVGAIFAYVIDLARVVVLAFQNIGRSIAAVASASVAVLQGNFSQAIDILERRMRGLMVEGRQAINLLTGGEGSTLRNYALGAPASTITQSAPVDLKSSARPGDDKSGKDASRLPGFEAQLADLRTRYALENDLREMSKAQELDYWRNVRDTQDLSAKDRAALSKKIAQVELESLREQRRARDAATKEDLAQLKELQKAQGEAAKQQAEVYGVRLDAAKASSLAQIEEAERVAEYEAGLGLISKEQLLATQREIAAERLAIETDYLNQKRALLEQDPDTNPAMLEQIEAQKAEIRRKYDAAIAENTRNQAAQSLQIWQSLTDRMGSLWDQGTQALLNGTLTWSNAMRAIGAQIVSWFATDVVGKQVKAWFVGEVTKTNATQSGVAARTAAESAGALQSVATWAAAAIKNIANSAWEAMAGAWKAMVGIPFIGPVLAPAIAATAFAGVIALAGNIRSAASGYDIPAGLNPMTQLHEEEMVLPKDIANPLRENLAGGGGLGGGVSVHITAMDSRDVQRALMEGGALHKALKNLQRGFAS